MNTIYKLTINTTKTNIKPLISSMKEIRPLPMFKYVIKNILIMELPQIHNFAKAMKKHSLYIIHPQVRTHTHTYIYIL